MKRVYLAGPDVFYPEPAKQASTMKGYCVKYGLEGVFPLDTVIEFPGWMSGPERAQKVFEANVDLLKSCDGLLANIIPFRGPSLDVGTSWEMGFAFALGKPVVAYSVPDRYYKCRVEEGDHEQHGCMIEDWDLVDNLMPICGSVALYERPYDAVERMAVILGVHKY